MPPSVTWAEDTGVDVRGQREAELRRHVHQRGEDAPERPGPQLLPELVVVSEVARVDAQPQRLRGRLEPRRAHEQGVLRGEFTELWQLPHRVDLRDVGPFLQAIGDLSAETDSCRQAVVQ